MSNLAMDRLRSRIRRESYVGTWLPEPILTSGDTAEEVTAAESVSMALLVVLETLGPLQRVVFVLREVFGFSYAEIADASSARNLNDELSSGAFASQIANCNAAA